jgi:hypothetical protein
VLPAQRRITRKRFVALSAPLSAEHRRLSVQVAMRKLLLSQVAVQKAAATMPVLVDATAPHEKMLSGAGTMEEAVAGSGCEGAPVDEKDIASRLADPEEMVILGRETVIPPGTTSEEAKCSPFSQFTENYPTLRESHDSHKSKAAQKRVGGTTGFGTEASAALYQGAVAQRQFAQMSNLQVEKALTAKERVMKPGGPPPKKASEVVGARLVVVDVAASQEKMLSGVQAMTSAYSVKRRWGRASPLAVASCGLEEELPTQAPPTRKCDSSQASHHRPVEVGTCKGRQHGRYQRKSRVIPHSFVLPRVTDDDEPRPLLAQARAKDTAPKAAETKKNGALSARTTDEAIAGPECGGARGLKTDVAKMQADLVKIAMPDEEAVLPPRTLVFWNVRDAFFGYMSKHGSL